MIEKPEVGALGFPGVTSSLELIFYQDERNRIQEDSALFLCELTLIR